jgi:hypothetical protein
VCYIGFGEAVPFADELQSLPWSINEEKISLFCKCAQNKVLFEDVYALCTLVF